MLLVIIDQGVSGFLEARKDASLCCLNRLFYAREAMGRTSAADDIAGVEEVDRGMPTREDIRVWTSNELDLDSADDRYGWSFYLDEDDNWVECYRTPPSTA